MKSTIKFKYDYNYNLFSTVVYFVGTVVFFVIGCISKPLLLAFSVIGLGRTAVSLVAMRNEVEAILDDNHIMWPAEESKYRVNIVWADVKCHVTNNAKYTKLTINTGYSKHKLYFFGDNRVVIDSMVEKGIIG